MKRILVGLGILSLLIFAVPALAAPSKSPTAPPEIEKVVFVHYETGANSMPVWDDTQEDFRLIAGGIRWWSTISYEVNPAGSGLLDSASLIAALETSSETWDVETTGGFELFTPPTLTSGTSVGYDGFNRVVWGSLDPGVIAVTSLWYNPATKQIVEFDMVFNNAYSWSVTEEPDPDKMDVQNIATHELGHNGLADLRPPKDWALTMYAYTSLGETMKRDLGTGDILGIKKLYGN